MVPLATDQADLTNFAKRETSYFTSADFLNDSIVAIGGLEQIED